MEAIETMPHAIIAEKSILSAMFQKPGTIAKAAAEGITAEAFHIPAHRSILSHLIRCRDSGHLTEEGQIDITVFVQSAHMDGMIDWMGGAAEVYGIFTYATNLSGWPVWCDHLRECKARRIAHSASRAIGEATDSEEAITAASEALEAMRKAVTAKTRAMNAQQASDDFLSKYVASYEAGDIPGDSTGIEEIDAVTGGMRSGELWTIGGKSSSGKSVFMYQVASEFISAGKTVAVFSMELMAHEIVGRLITLAARVRYDAITKPKSVLKHEMDKIRSAVGTMRNSRLWVDASSGQTLDSIATEAERIRDIEGDIALIVVDYVQIVTGQRQRNETKEQEIARVSSGLKQLAKKMECPVLTGCQLNENNQTRDSRAIEQDSDALLLIEEKGILLKKVRNGERGGIINLALDGSAQRFRRFVG